MEIEFSDILEVLSVGKIELKGEFLWGSNYTYLTEVEDNRARFPAVYKPIRGERPLWDFPPASLAKREAAAFLVSEALNWRFVPPTVYREDAPLGSGSLQLFVEHDPEYHYFTFDNNDRLRLQSVVLFDVIINNADRKGSHVLLDPQGAMWLIDHGVCFHVEDKLRTVIWDFAGQPIPHNLIEDMEEFLLLFEEVEEGERDLREELSVFLTSREIKALVVRTRRLISQGFFPVPDPTRRQFPWPQI